ncbi:MAG: hypothetical protein ACFFD4_29310 [Candidatus Odinarchaeota archaeon]
MSIGIHVESATAVDSILPDRILIISDSDSSNNLVSKLKNEGPGSEVNYSFIKIEESLSFQKVILESNLEQYNTIIIILSDFEDESFNSTVIAELGNQITNGVSIGVISSRIWKAEDAFKEFLGIDTPETDPEYNCEDEEVVTFIVQNDTYLTSPHSFMKGQEVNISTDIGIITGTDENTETIILSENLGELPEFKHSGIYLKSLGNDKGKILTIPISLDDIEDGEILDLITSISYHTITWSTQLVLLHPPASVQTNPQDSTSLIRSPLTGDFSYLLTPRNLFAAALVTGGVVAVGSGGVAAFKGISRARGKNKEDEEEWPLGTGWLLFILGPIIGIIVQIIYSPNIRKISYSDVQDHPTRRYIVDILEIKGFEHFNALRKHLGISVSSLTWHLQVMEDFSIIRTSTFGQYKVFYLVGKRPKKEEVVLSCTVRSKKAFKIAESFIKTSEWTVNNLSELLGLSYAMVKYHSFKLVSLGIMTFSEEKNSFRLVQEKKELLTWLIERETPQ